MHGCGHSSQPAGCTPLGWQPVLIEPCTGLLCALLQSLRHPNIINALLAHHFVDSKVRRHCAQRARGAAGMQTPRSLDGVEHQLWLPTFCSLLNCRGLAMRKGSRSLRSPQLQRRSARAGCIGFGTAWVSDVLSSMAGWCKRPAEAVALLGGCTG
jgi:hypothetical protein